MAAVMVVVTGCATVPVRPELPPPVEMPDGRMSGSEPAYELEWATLKPKNEPEQTVAGGCWLDTRTCVDAGKAYAGDKTENNALKASVPSVGWSLIWFGGGLLVGGAAVAIGVCSAGLCAPR